MIYLLKVLGLYKDHVALMTQRSSNAFNLFNRTVDELESINDEISFHHHKRQVVIDQASSEQKSLMQQHQANTKLINKITEFLK